MKTHTAVALAMLSMSVLAGLAAVPVQALDPDCTEDFPIPDSEQASPETLGAGENETWAIDVTAAGGDATVRVKLTSNFDELNFEIFEQNGSCASSDDVLTPACENEVTLDTRGLVMPPQSQDCELDAPDSDTRTFYFVLENPQQDSLEFTIWEL